MVRVNLKNVCGVALTSVTGARSTDDGVADEQRVAGDERTEHRRHSEHQQRHVVDDEAVGPRPVGQPANEDAEHGGGDADH